MGHTYIERLFTYTPQVHKYTYEENMQFTIAQGVQIEHSRTITKNLGSFEFKENLVSILLGKLLTIESYSFFNIFAHSLQCTSLSFFVWIILERLYSNVCQIVVEVARNDLEDVRSLKPPRSNVMICSIM